MCEATWKLDLPDKMRRPSASVLSISTVLPFIAYMLIKSAGFVEKNT